MLTIVDHMPDWWDDLLPPPGPYRKAPGQIEMLRVIAYDISDPKRLRQIAEICQDHGLRVQYSLFECWLDEERFAELWRRLCVAIEKTQDRLVAYTLDTAAARRRVTAGDTMICTEKRIDCFFG